MMLKIFTGFPFTVPEAILTPNSNGIGVVEDMFEKIVLVCARLSCIEIRNATRNTFFT